MMGALHFPMEFFNPWVPLHHVCMLTIVLSVILFPAKRLQQLRGVSNLRGGHKDQTPRRPPAEIPHAAGGGACVLYG